jgi:hypothetical protein
VHGSTDRVEDLRRVTFGSLAESLFQRDLHRLLAGDPLRIV